MRPLRTLALFAVLALAACVHNTMWTVDAPSSEEQQGAPVRIKVDEIYSQGGHLWVEAEIVNGGAEPLVVDRDRIVLVFPDGRRMPRRRSYGKATIAVPPNDTRKVNFDFEDPGLDWDRMPRLTIDFSAAVTTAAAGAPVEVPQIVTHP